MFSTKEALEAGNVGPIGIYCNDLLFGVWEEEGRTSVRKAAHPFEGEIRYQVGQSNYSKIPTSSLITTLHPFKAFLIPPQ